METPLVSVIIATYNRFTYLLNAISSVKNQTYKNIEIIIVNDCSTQKEYYNYNFEGCTMLNLSKNSKEIFGYACGGYVRNQGLRLCNGKYVAFLDDDDIFLPTKIEEQVNCLESSKLPMCSTEGYYGEGIFDTSKRYPLYNREHYWNYISKQIGVENDYPNEITFDIINKHNIIIHSSVMMLRDFVIGLGGYECVRNGEEDYGLWKRALQKSNSGYIKIPLFYYDGSHGSGQNY